MEFAELIKLFEKTRKRKEWGERSYILVYSDGSGEVISEDNLYEKDGAFEFENEYELIKKLKE